MAVLHFLNVKTGDCSIIQHNTGHVSVIDVCNAQPWTTENLITEAVDKISAKMEKGVLGNFNQKDYPVNPISYMKNLNISSIFRFILTHPDMDHMDGLAAFCDEFSPSNFWDTDNTETKDFGSGVTGGFNEADWEYYKTIRDGKPTENPRRLTIDSGQIGKYWNQDDIGGGGDGIQILAPSKELVAQGCETGDYNDCSYVLLYRAHGYRILFGGDSHDSTWEHILEEHKADVTDVDVLIAPHHGRDSGRSFEFLDVVNPSLTLFGNAESEFLAYAAWNNRGLQKITNNQAGSIVLDTSGTSMSVYVSCEAFARKSNAFTFKSETHAGFYYLQSVGKARAAGA